MPRALLIALLAALLACGGCASDRSLTAQLNGHTFFSTRVVGHELVKGTRFRLDFDDGSMGSGSGCNGFGGDYEVRDGRLYGSLGETQMLCRPAQQAQDRWFAELISHGARVSIDGDRLTLARGARIVVLKRSPTRPPF